MKVSRKLAVGIMAASMVLGSFVVSGQVLAAPKPPPPPPANTTLRVTCIDWFYSNANQWHVEAHVKDGDGNPVVGAVVKFQNWVAPADGTTPYVYQTKDGTSYTWAGYNPAPCGSNASSTVTDSPCVPKALSAPDGLYYAKILSVTKAGYTWDGKTPSNSFTRVSPK